MVPYSARAAMGAAGKEQCQKLCSWIPFLQHKEIRTQVLDSEPADQSDVSVQSVPPGGFCHGRGGNELSPPHTLLHVPDTRVAAGRTSWKGFPCTPWAASWLPAARWSFENESLCFHKQNHSPTFTLLYWFCATLT